MATNPYSEQYQQAAQSMMQAGIGSLSGNTINNNMGLMTPGLGGPLAPPPKPWQSAEGYNLPTNVEKEFNKFQVRANEPVARDLENWVFDHRRNKGLYPMNIDSVPIPGGGWHVRDRNLRKIQPIINAGIANSNLRGARVWNAGGPFAGDYPLPGMQWLEHKLFGDPDAKDPPPVGEDGELLPGWELHQDGWHYFPPNEGEERYEEMLPTLTAGMDDSWQYLQRQIDELNPDSPNYEDQLELLQSDMDMKYPWMQTAELGLPADTSWQDIKMPQGMDLQQLIDLGASEEQIAQVLGLA